MEIRLRPELGLKSKVRLGLRIRFSHIHTLPESQFALMVRELEQNPLFKRLMGLQDPQWKAVKYRRFPNTRQAHEYQLLTDTNESPGTPDFGSFLSQKTEAIPLIHQIGEEDFSRYFLHGEISEASPDTINRWGLKQDELEKVLDFVNALAIQSSFETPTTVDMGNVIRYSRVAEIAPNSSTDSPLQPFEIRFFSPQLTRGRYAIDYERIRQLKAKAVFSKEELRHLKDLLDSMELVNARKSLTYNLIRVLVDKQGSYLTKHDPLFLKALTQKDLAAELKVNPSTVCRAVYGRSVLTPWGEEKPLAFLLPNPKKICQFIIQEVLDEPSDLKTDQEISIFLRQKYNLSVSRRSVAYYRKELKSGGIRGRKQGQPSSR